jgi:hypothetical protein
MRDPPTENRPASRRNLNAWIDDEAPKTGKPFHVSVNIGPAKDRAASAPFVEPNWGDTETVNLLVSLSSVACSVEPDSHRLVLPRRGPTETIVFTVVANEEGQHKFSIKVHLEKQLTLLQSYGFVVKVQSVARELAAQS